MKKIETEVLVIGGGATGTGIARDLAMRGFKTVLVEKGDLTHGTTGRYHGLLHSGARYAVKDPQAALECKQENMILRRIMPHCLEDTGGFFVLTEWDEPGYAEKLVVACKEVGILVEEISISRMLKEEPLLNPNIQRCFRVPDGSADSFLGAELNAESARQFGAQILNYHKVIQLIPGQSHTNQKPPLGATPGSVTGAICHDLLANEQVAIYSNMIINASGAWVSQIAESIGIKIPVISGKGTMVAVNHRIVNTVINRCKMPSDGDILVPIHTVAVIGTTDVPVPDPDHYPIETWEVELCLEEGEKLVPGFKQMRMLRAWAGVRPLYVEKASSGTRDITRSFVLLDHAERDGVDSFVTITSGKWTTYRKMAEATVDLVCQKLQVNRPCRTHQEILPAKDGHIAYYQVGHRLRKIEAEKAYGQLICECELATRQDVEHAILQDGAKSLDDIRRKIRLGMGPCQGGFCSFRAIGILNELAHKVAQSADDRPKPWLPVANLALRDFLQERWKGLLPIMWGQQLRQERLNEYIYLYVLNAGMLPGPEKSPISSVNYDRAGNGASWTPPHQNVEQSVVAPLAMAPVEILVVGAGLAGLVTAWQLASRGRQVRVITMGWGATHWGTGCIDLLGKHPDGHATNVDNPKEAIEVLIETESNHPYSLAGMDATQRAVSEFLDLCEQAGYPLKGSLEKNWLLPTALGVARPTCLAPETMIAGDLRMNDSMLILGLEGYHDFYPTLISDNLTAQGVQADGIMLSLPSLKNRKLITSRTLAELCDHHELIDEICKAVKNHLNGVKRIGLPAVLGLRYARKNQQKMEARLGVPVFEIPTLPPSIAGMRLHNLLVNKIQSLHGVILNGMEVCGAVYDANRIIGINTKAAQRILRHGAKSFVLATGGILGGGVRTDNHGYAQDTALGMPIDISPDRAAWHAREFTHPNGHSIHRAGFKISQDFRLVPAHSTKALDNAFAVGSAIGGYDGIPERSLEGVALVTGHLVGSRI